MRILRVSLLRTFLYIWHLWVTMQMLSFRYLLQVAPLPQWKHSRFLEQIIGSNKQIEARIAEACGGVRKRMQNSFSNKNGYT